LLGKPQKKKKREREIEKPGGGGGTKAYRRIWEGDIKIDFGKVKYTFWV